MPDWLTAEFPAGGGGPVKLRMKRNASARGFRTPACLPPRSAEIAAMSTVQEIKAAATKLTAEERAELSRQQPAETDAAREDRIRRWRELAAKANAEVGPITWKREDLYER